MDPSFFWLKRHWGTYVLDESENILTLQDMAKASAHLDGVCNSHFDILELDHER